MSENTDPTTSSMPKTERWVIMMVWAFVPAIAALFVPESLRAALLAVSGSIFITSFVLMLRQSRRERNERH